MFFAPAAVTLRSLALTVNSALNVFISNFRTAVNPQIVKKYAAGDHQGSKKLALASTTSRFTGDNSAVIEKWADLAAKKKILELINCFIEAVYSKEFAEKFGELIRQMLIGVSADELHRFEIYARACNGFDVYDKLDKITCPVYAAGATGDKVFGCEPIAELAEKTNAQLYIYENYSHAVYDEAPDFIERLVKFFDE